MIDKIRIDGIVYAVMKDNPEYNIVEKTNV